MRLQIAIDLTDGKGAIQMAELLYDVVDIIEIGTPVIMLEGQHPVRELRAKYPKATILDDTKIVDGGCLEARYACVAGADIITILAVADDLTIQAAIDECHRLGKEALIDLINIDDVVKRAQEVEKMGADYVCVHTASDVKVTGKDPVEELKMVSNAVKHVKISVGGGITKSNIHEIIALHPDTIIIGTAITSSKDIKETTAYFYNLIKNA